MITHFEKHVQDLSENTLTLSEIEAAKAKLESFQRGEGTYDEISHEVDRFFGAEQAPLLVKYEELIEQELFVMKDKTKVQGELTKWEDGKLSNAEMVAGIEKE